MQTEQPVPSASSAPKSADDRATGFEAVQGGPQMQSGGALLIEAYAVLWVILMTWLWFMWRKQAALHTELDDLEKTIDKAAAKMEKEKK